jgi:hypothetical protein
MTVMVVSPASATYARAPSGDAAISCGSPHRQRRDALQRLGVEQRHAVARRERDGHELAPARRRERHAVHAHGLHRRRVDRPCVHPVDLAVADEDVVRARHLARRRRPAVGGVRLEQRAPDDRRVVGVQLVARDAPEGEHVMGDERVAGGRATGGRAAGDEREPVDARHVERVGHRQPPRRAAPRARERDHAQVVGVGDEQVPPVGGDGDPVRPAQRTGRRERRQRLARRRSRRQRPHARGPRVGDVHRPVGARREVVQEVRARRGRRVPRAEAPGGRVEGVEHRRRGVARLIEARVARRPEDAAPRVHVDAHHGREAGAPARHAVAHGAVGGDRDDLALVEAPHEHRARGRVPRRALGHEVALGQRRPRVRARHGPARALDRGRHVDVGEARAHGGERRVGEGALRVARVPGGEPAHLARRVVRAPGARQHEGARENHLRVVGQARGHRVGQRHGPRVVARVGGPAGLLQPGEERRGILRGDGRGGGEDDERGGRAEQRRRAHRGRRAVDRGATAGVPAPLARAS